MVARTAEISSPRFTGRGTELDQLTRSLAIGPALVLVEGEAGIGKTRLLQELFARRADSLGRTLRAACPPVREPFTLGPLVDVLRQADPALAELGLTALCGALRPLFPDWATALPPQPEPAEDAPAARHRLFAALVELLTRLQVQLLVVEDAHWADEATLEFLLFAAAQVPRPVSLVVTYRPEDVPLRSMLRRLSRSAAGEQGLLLSLGPLDALETAEVISSMLGGEHVSAEFATFVYTRTEGLPLAVEEAVRAMGERADLAHRDGAWMRRPVSEIDVPSAVRDLVLDRFGRLSADAQAVLSTAAVLAAPTDEDTLEAVTALARHRTMAGLTEGLSCHLLREDPRGQVMFRHALAGQAVREAIPGPERRALHLRAAEALERSAPLPIGRLARHFREAGEIERWCEYGEQAADLATASGDEATAEILLLDLITCGALPGEDIARLASKVRFATADGRARYPDLVRSLRLTSDRADLDPRVAGEIRCRLGSTLMMLYDYDAGARELERAIPDLDHDPVLAGWAMTLLGCPFGSSQPATTHLAWLSAAETTLGDLPSDGMNLAGLRSLALLTLGEPSGWAQADLITTDEPKSSDRLQTARNNLNIGHAAIFWGRYAEAERRLTAALRLATAHDYGRTQSAVRLVQVHLDCLTGRWRGLVDRAALLSEDEDIAAPARLEAALVLAVLDGATGAVPEAMRSCRKVIDESRPLGQVNLWLEAAGALARMLRVTGRVDDSIPVLEPPARLVCDKGIWLWATEIAPGWVDALTSTARVAEARDFTMAFAAGLGSRVAPAAQAALLACRAVLAEAEGDCAQAAALFSLAAAGWEAMPRPYEALLTGEREAACLFAGGQQEEAVSLLSAVLDGLSRLGATGDASRVARVLRHHGVHVRRAGAGRPSYGDRLSPREHDVAVLVATGRTDREIAQILFLSPRTVASHVASARRKLHAPSRTALAVSYIEAGIVGGATDGIESVVLPID